MADIVPPAVRSRMMAGIRAKNTKPEMAIRRGLHRLGLRFRLHDKRLPGKPDLVFPKYRAVIFVHGCFWHGHECHGVRIPATRTEFWQQKIERNIERDAAVRTALDQAGWRHLTSWECQIKQRNLEAILAGCIDWLQKCDPSRL